VGKKRQRLPKSSAFFFGIFAGGSRAAGCLAIDEGRARALNMSIRHADFVRKGLLQICDDPDKSTLVVSAATKLSNRGSIAPMCGNGPVRKRKSLLFLRRIVAESQQKQA
jgi:hypothetical protein